MNFAKSERAELCDLFDKVGPDAPTLTGSWDAHDLAAHLWIRESDPLAAAGIAARPLAGLTERRMSEVRRRWPFPELVEKIRNGPARFSVLALPGVDEAANASEFFVHHEDVRRAGAEPLPPRPLPDDIETWLWRRLKLLGRAYFRRAGVGVVLDRAGATGSPGPEGSTARGETLRVASGPRTVTIIGPASELTLFAHGRTGAAQVTLVGEPDAVEAIRSARLGT
jgi:uncharacterized protein (TIGR03085 family)